MYKLAKLRGKWHLVDNLLFEGKTVKLMKNKLMIYDNTINHKLTLEEFNNKYEKLLKKIINYLENDDDTDSNIGVFYMDELSKLREELRYYSKYLTKSELDKFIRNIRLLANEIKHKSFHLSNRITRHKVR